MTETSGVSQFVLPRGFRFGAAKAGLKKSGRTDFALIVADAPASAAAVFTANRVIAAPLMVDKEHLRATGGKVRVVAINAGNANCCLLYTSRCHRTSTIVFAGVRTSVFPAFPGAKLSIFDSHFASSSRHFQSQTSAA